MTTSRYFPRRLAASPVTGAAMLALAVLALTTLPRIAAISDFHNDLYPAATAVLHGTDLYAAGLRELSHGIRPTAYIYPPLAAVLLAPLALVAPATAATVFFWVNAVACCALAGLIAQLAPARLRLLAAAVALLAIASFAPARAVSSTGQLDLLVVSLTLAGLLLVDRNHDVLGGVLLGISAAIKIYPLVFLLYFAVVRRRTRLAVAGAVALALGFVVPSLVLRGNPLADFGAVVLASRQPGFVAFPYGYALPSMLDRALRPTPYAHPLANLPGALVDGLIYVALAGTAWQILRMRRQPDSRLIPVVCLVTLMTAPFADMFHLTLLLVALPILLLGTALEPEEISLRNVAMASMVGITSVLAVANSVIGPRWTTRLVLVGMAVAGTACIAATGTRHLRRSIPWVCIAVGYVGVASPSFLGMVSWWGVPISGLHLLLGEGQLYLLGLMLVGILLLRQRALGSTAAPLARSFAPDPGGTTGA